MRCPESQSIAYIENMSVDERNIAYKMFIEELEHEETDHKNFNDWLSDYVFFKIFEDGLDD